MRKLKNLVYKKRKPLTVLALLLLVTCYITLENKGNGYNQRLDELLLFTMQDQQEATFQKSINPEKQGVVFPSLQHTISSDVFQVTQTKNNRNSILRSICFVFMTLFCVFAGIIFSEET